MKLGILLIVLLITTIISQTSFATNSTDESGTYNIHCTHVDYSHPRNGSYPSIDEYLNITYHITNATITNFDTNKNNQFLTMSIKNSTNGFLSVDVPRNFFGTNQLIFTDVEVTFPKATVTSMIPFHSKTNSTDQFLTINLPNGDFGLWISLFGTPEQLGQYEKTCVVVTEFGQSGNDQSKRIICTNSILLEKLSDNEIICVKTQTADILIKRGFAINASATHIFVNCMGCFFNVEKGYYPRFNQDNGTIFNFTGLEYPSFLNLIKLADYLNQGCSTMGLDWDHCVVYKEQHELQIQADGITSSSLANLMLSDSRFHWVHPNAGYFAKIKVNGDFYLVTLG